jgi:DNA-binding winged helix-turn-helix (wHTH) protein
MATTIVSPLTPQALSGAASSEALNQREAVLLQTLVANQGRVVTRTELARAVGLRQQARRVDVHLVNVRRALDDSLINVRGRGWMVPRGYELSPACQAELDAHITASTFAATELSATAPAMSA